MVNYDLDILSLAITISYIGIYASFAISLIRLLKGPTFADRAISLDLIGYLTLGLIAIYIVDSKEKSLLDVAITLALVVFLSTIAFAKFISRDKGAGE